MQKHESTLGKMLNPYEFLHKKAISERQSIFGLSFLFKNIIGLTGKEGAELFYDESKFIRKGAAPLFLRKALFGEGSVHSLDGDAFLHRKTLFTSLMTASHMNKLSMIMRHKLIEALVRWTGQDKIIFYEEIKLVLTQVVCEWAGVPLEKEELKQRSADLAAMFEGVGSPLKYPRALLGRKRSEAWASELITKIRQGAMTAPEGSVLEAVTYFEDFDGELLETHTAAVELLNFLRPTVAVSVYCVFGFHALHTQPAVQRRRLLEDENYLRGFIEEVRRFYPFFPAVVAKVRSDFDWKGRSFKEGQLAMLDLYGTNHDEEIYESPYEFRPDRLSKFQQKGFSFLPQGGGDPRLNHRCPGEPIVWAIMSETIRFLVEDISYHVPDQNLDINFRELPAMPKDRIILDRIHFKSQVQRAHL